MIDILAWFESEMPPVSLIWGGSAVPLPAPGGSLYLNVQGHSGYNRYTIGWPNPVLSSKALGKSQCPGIRQRHEGEEGGRSGGHPVVFVSWVLYIILFP
jgi:hypothetical protein